MNPIYLDNNATTQILPSVVEAMADYVSVNFGNPASQHCFGRSAQKTLHDAQCQIIKILGGRHAGMNADQLIITSGGTESNNLAVFGLVGDAPSRVLISAVEHPSLLMTVEPLRRLGHQVKMIRVNENGVCDLTHLEELLQIPTRLVCVMLGNNETGCLQPVSEIAKLCADFGSLFHCDAVQGVGKIPLSFQKLGADSVALTAHKFHGPKGVGGLLVKDEVEVAPILFGGFQQMGVRPGTESVELVLGMNKALEHWHTFDANRTGRIERLRDLLEIKILEQLPDVHVHAQNVARLPHTSNISFFGVDRQSFLMAADLAKLAVSTGSACSSGSSEPSHVLTAMGCSQELISSSIRISLGAETTEAEVLEACQRICKIFKHLRS